MTPLQQVREWLKTYPGYDQISKFRLDWTDEIPGTAGLFPDGLSEVSRRETIIGGVRIVNQYNFGLYTRLSLASDDDIASTRNAEWVADFQGWVQQQSATHAVPVFGDEPGNEITRAQNGQLYAQETEGTALYMVQLSIQFVKTFK